MRCVKAGMMSVCVAVLMIGTKPALGRADTVSLDISNPGFDTDVMPAEEYTVTAPWGWSGSGGVFGCQLGNAGLAALSSPNWAWISNGDYPDGGLGQRLMAGGSSLRAEAGGKIEINLSQGHRTDYMANSTQQFHIELWRNAIGTGTLVYDSGDLGNVAPGSWESRSVSYTTTAGDVGQDLYVRLWAPVAVQVQLENVSGSYTSPVPEPSMLVLSTLGSLGLLAYAWRKRR